MAIMHKNFSGIKIEILMLHNLKVADICILCTRYTADYCAKSLDKREKGDIIEASTGKKVTDMMTIRDDEVIRNLEKQLLNKIEKSKKFSWSTLAAVIELDGLMHSRQQTY